MPSSANSSGAWPACTSAGAGEAVCGRHKRAERQHQRQHGRAAARPFAALASPRAQAVGQALNEAQKAARNYASSSPPPAAEKPLPGSRNPRFRPWAPRRSVCRPLESPPGGKASRPPPTRGWKKNTAPPAPQARPKNLSAGGEPWGPAPQRVRPGPPSRGWRISAGEGQLLLHAHGNSCSPGCPAPLQLKRPA